MKIALLADLHGNLPATLAVEADIRKRNVAAIYCLGDIVGKGPDSPETMDWALAACEIVLAGNWDLGIAKNSAGNEQAHWYAEQLGEERLQKLCSLPLEHRFTFSGRKIRLLHGRPTVPECVFPSSPKEEQLALFDIPDRPDMVGFADIHSPFYLQLNEGGILFNIGSVGNPLSRQPYATYTILEGKPGDGDNILTHAIVTVPYDREEAVQRALRASGLPNGDAYINEVRTGKYSR